MDELWYEETLTPTDDAVASVIARTQRDNQSQTTDKTSRHDIQATAQGIVRIHKPRWEELDSSENKLLTSGQSSRFFLVRLGFEFEITPQAKTKHVSFIYAKCMAWLRPQI